MGCRVNNKRIIRRRIDTATHNSVRQRAQKDRSRRQRGQVYLHAQLLRKWVDERSRVLPCGRLCIAPCLPDDPVAAPVYVVRALQPIAAHTVLWDEKALQSRYFPTEDKEPPQEIEIEFCRQLAQHPTACCCSPRREERGKEQIIPQMPLDAVDAEGTALSTEDWNWCWRIQQRHADVRKEPFTQGRSSRLVLFPQTALLEHSCLPNTAVVREQSFQTRVVSVSDLAAGEILTACIDPNLLACGDKRRRIELQARGIDCRCRRCTLSVSSWVRQEMEQCLGEQDAEVSVDVDKGFARLSRGPNCAATPDAWFSGCILWLERFRWMAESDESEQGESKDKHQDRASSSSCFAGKLRATDTRCFRLRDRMLQVMVSRFRGVESVSAPSYLNVVYGYLLAVFAEHICMWMTLSRRLPGAEIIAVHFANGFFGILERCPAFSQEDRCRIVRDLSPDLPRLFELCGLPFA